MSEPLDIEWPEGAFTKVFWRLQDVKTRKVLNMGGAGSSKSWSQAQHELIYALQHPKIRTLIVRKVGATIKDSVRKLVWDDLIKEYGLTGVASLNLGNNTITLANGSEIIFRGLDDSEKIKSIQKINRIWCEELTEFDEKDWDQLNLRLRGVQNAQMTGTFNPIYVGHWIDKKYKIAENGYSIVDSDVTLLRSTFEDNQFLDDQYVKELKKYKTSNPFLWQVYGMGEFGVEQADNAFAYAYDPNVHNSPVAEFDPEDRLHIAFDFNLEPFTCLFFHFSPGRYFYVFDSLEIKKGNIEEMIDRINHKYGTHLYSATVTGDAMGKRGDLSQRDNASYYEQIRRRLRLSPKQLILPANPTHKNSRAQVNYTLSNHPHLYINPDTCPGLVRDLRIVEVGDNGKIKKSNRKDVAQQADFLDNFRYAVNTHLYRWIQNSMKSSPLKNRILEQN